MIRTAKIALPKEDLARIEKIRKELKLARSAVFDIAIRFWLNYMEKSRLIKQYEDGYRRVPEPVGEIEALEKMSAEAFVEEDNE
jgi:hypothetical protein